MFGKIQTADRWFSKCIYQEYYFSNLSNASKGTNPYKYISQNKMLIFLEKVKN